MSFPASKSKKQLIKNRKIQFFLDKNNKIHEIEREKFMKIEINPDFVVLNPFTGEPWVYNDEITELFEKMRLIHIDAT